MGKILTRPELQGGCTVNGVEVISASGEINAPVSPGDVTLASGKVLYGVADVGVGKTLTVPFAGTAATISPTASSSTPTFTGSAHTLAGTVAAPTFTGTAPTSALNLATPAFSGTGLTAAGQAITTTDNQTMTLNQCAGMWLIPATGATPAVLILSNTAVSGAPAVFTVQGAAMTDAGAYKVVKALTPVGTNSAPAFSGESYTPAGTVSAPTITVTGASYTPAGTNTPTFS